MPKTEEGAKPQTLRRSSRSTRGSIKPIVDLTEPDLSGDESETISKTTKVKPDDDDVAVQSLDDGEDDEDFDSPKTKTKKKRNSTGKKQTTSSKKQPPARQPVSKSVTKPLNAKAAKISTVKASKSVSDGKEETQADGSLDADDVDVEFDYILNEAEMKEVNYAFDKNCSSDNEELLDAAHLKTAIRSIGFEPRADEIKKLLKKFSNSAGKINRDGFHKIMALKMGAAPGTNDRALTDEISKVFNLLDLDKTGMITLENLKSISKELNEEIDDEELLEMITEADLDGDLKINKDEFHNIMKKTSLY